MPAVPNKASSVRATHFTPPDPNLPHDINAHKPSLNPIPQPSPKVISTKSHEEEREEGHFLARRFLGGIPQKVINSDELVEKTRRLVELRKNAISHLPIIRHRLKDDDSLSFDLTLKSSNREAEGEGSLSRERQLIRDASKRIKVIKRGKNGQEVKESLNLNIDSPSHEDSYGYKGADRSKDKDKSIWLGDSFDIGREFLGKIVHEEEEDEQKQDEGEEGSNEVRSGNDLKLSPNEGKGKGKETSKKDQLSRPPVSTRTTQETFVTARTELSTSSSFHTQQDQGSSSKSTLNMDGDVDLNNPLDNFDSTTDGYQLTPQPSLTIEDEIKDDNKKKLRNSQSSSIQPLISNSLYENPEPTPFPSNEPNDRQTENDDQVIKNDPEGNGQTLEPEPQKQKNGISTRLKSALRKPSNPKIKSSQSTFPTSSSSNNNNQPSNPPMPDLRNGKNAKQGKSKSVQFPIDPIQGPTPTPGASLKRVQEEEGQSLQGDKSPVSPLEVLERSGEDAVGTSHQAVEEALEEEEEEDWEEVKRPGEVILRDRMIVRVGYHREDNISGFDEASQRRNPCARLDPLEEYIVVYRKGQIELYSNYTYPFQEKIVGHKHLAFVIPLLPNRTNLTIFNSEDVALCLTTSVNKLQDDMTYIMRSTTTRAGALKDKVKQSRQIRWLRGRRRGSQIFILKLGERSRSLDWYWEIWRELNGELPPRFDISIPSLSTSIRLFISKKEEDMEYNMVGTTSQLLKYNKNKVIQNCWEMLLNSNLNIEELKRQSEINSSTGQGANKLNIQLAWKNLNGNLDWIAYDNTVQGKKRDWNLLSGLARGQGESQTRELQLRPARHQPNIIKLEDGTLLEEPPGVEGYLTRHKDGSTKEQVYISSHDGNIFVGHMKDAKPPLLPSQESSTPSDLFPELYKSFMDDEHRRMTSFLQRCSGCIDLRDIVSINIIPEKSKNKSANSGPRSRTTSSTSQSHNQAGFSRIPTEGSIYPTTQEPGELEGKTFEVHVNTGGDVRFEAQSPEIAKEWVDRLRDLKRYWERRHRVDARQRMDAIAIHSHENPFTGTELSNESDEFISEIWDWCVIKGCRSTCISGRLYMKKDKWDKFRSKYIVLTGGTLVSFKIKKKNAFHTRKKRYPLFGAYVYSGMLALDELPSTSSSDVFTSQSRVYQDGLQSSDGAEDTTFCVRLATSSTIHDKGNSSWNKSKKKSTQPWENEDLKEENQTMLPPDLSKKPNQLLIFRARSKLERDRWVWAINAEMERQVRSHVKQEEILRNYGNVPERW